jgi:hypothetical protein
MELPPNIELLGERIVGYGYLRFGAISSCCIPLEPDRCDDSNGIEHALIAPKEYGATPKYGNGGGKDGAAGH